MKKRNVYAAMVFMFMAGSIWNGNHEFKATITILTAVASYLIATGLAFGESEKQQSLLADEEDKTCEGQEKARASM